MGSRFIFIILRPDCSGNNPKGQGLFLCVLKRVRIFFLFLALCLQHPAFIFCVFFKTSRVKNRVWGGWEGVGGGRGLTSGFWHPVVHVLFLELFSLTTLKGFARVHVHRVYLKLVVVNSCDEATSTTSRTSRTSSSTSTSSSPAWLLMRAGSRDAELSFALCSQLELACVAR